jgi:hypothetical protein
MTLPSLGDKRRNPAKNRTEVYAQCPCGYVRWVHYRVGVTSQQRCVPCARRRLNKIRLNPKKKQ